jgi:tetratricopeptide (TPR) repeat protein
MSAALDGHLRAWGVMYTDSCEATNVRREQSAEVLDLRMSCLRDNLDQVRALTNALMTADAAAVSRAVTAANDLTPVSRCADVALLRSAVPPPRDERTLREVQRLRRSLADVKGMRDIGKVAPALATARALLPQVKSTGYRPLLGAALFELGVIQCEHAPDESETTLEEAVMTAAGAGDEETAALAASALAYAVGYQFGRLKDGMRWAAIAHAFLDHLGGDRSRIRAWLVGTEGAMAWSQGDFEKSAKLVEQSIGMFVRALGADHLDVALGSSNLAFSLLSLHRPEDALAAANRAVRILGDHGDPNSPVLGNATYNRGEALRAMGRLGEARAAFEGSLQIAESNAQALPTGLGDPLTGLAELAIAEGKAAAAVPLLERALSVRPPGSAEEIAIADTQFALARALWGTGGDKPRARSLAAKAREVFARHHHRERDERAGGWLAAHPTS